MSPTDPGRGSSAPGWDTSYARAAFVTAAYTRCKMQISPWALVATCAHVGCKCPVSSAFKLSVSGCTWSRNTNVSARIDIQRSTASESQLPGSIPSLPLECIWFVLGSSLRNWPLQGWLRPASQKDLVANQVLYKAFIHTSLSTHQRSFLSDRTDIFLPSDHRLFQQRASVKRRGMLQIPDFSTAHLSRRGETKYRRERFFHHFYSLMCFIPHGHAASESANALQLRSFRSAA